MEGKEIISALCGLSGAVGNSGKTAGTDDTVRKAFCVFLDLNTGGETREEERKAAEAVREEKYTVSPDCRTCRHPCGNTSDRDMSGFEQEDPELRKKKEAMLMAAGRYCRQVSGPDDGAGDRRIELPDAVYRALVYFGYDLVAESYDKVTFELMSLMQEGAH